MKKFVVKTKNGFDVYVDMETSHAATHLQKHPNLFEIAKKILSGCEVTSDELRFETDTGVIVGDTDLVRTEEGDDVFYAKRPNREKYSRFVRGKKAATTTLVTIDVRKSGEGEYDLYTTYVGGIVPSFPTGKEDANYEQRQFWATHALVAGNQDILSETVTTECPW